MKATISIPVGLAYGADEVVPDIEPGLDVLDAAYHTVHDYPGGVAALAVRMRMSSNTLTHKVNLNNSTHHLTLREAVAMQHMSGNVAVLQAMAEALGYVCVKAKPAAASGDPLHQVMEMTAEFADVLHAASDAISSGSVTPNAMRRFDHQVAELQAAANALAGTLRSMMPLREGPKK
jgi:hypothetical protein